MEEFFENPLAYLHVYEEGNSALTLKTILVILGMAILISFVIMLVYMFTHRKTMIRNSTAITVLALGPIVAIIVLGVGSNLARAISIGGGLALIRFRHSVTDPKDMIYMYLSIACGMACGIGYYGFSILAAVMVLIVLIVFDLVRNNKRSAQTLHLKITIPETLNFDSLFEEELNQFCKRHTLEKTETVDYGTLIELTYGIQMKDPSQQKALIDALRVKNGNLNISIVQYYETN
ncbi:MAG: DUF4956 domain-containing protein [Clostridia bacterium]|nr:DUF4956 domain-containing protein [Clostridia bacterium]